MKVETRVSLSLLFTVFKSCKNKSGNESEIVFTVKQREGGRALLSFQKLEWVDEKLSKVNKANKAGNIQNCGKALK